MSARHAHRTALLLLVLAAALMSLAAPAAAAELSWQPVSDTLDSGTSSAARDGDEVLVAGVRGDDVRLSTIGGQPSAVRTRVLASGRVSGSGNPPIVLASPSGVAAVVWQELGTGGWQLRAAVRPSRGADFGEPTTISAYPGAGFARGFAADIARDGRILVAWWGGPSGGTLGIYASTWRPGRSWSTPVDLAQGTYPVPPPSFPSPVSVGAAIGAHGDLAVAWDERTFGGPAASVTRRRVALSPPEPAWQAPVTVAQSPFLGFGARPLAVHPDGSASVAWTQPPEGDPAAVCVHSGRIARGGHQTSQELTCQQDLLAGGAALALDAAGNGVLLWHRVPRFGAGSPLRASVQAFARPAGAPAWSAPTEVVADALGYFDLPSLQPLGDGRFLVATTMGQAILAADQGRVAVAIIGSDGAPLTRLGAPEMPRRTGDAGLRFHDFGASGPGGLLTWHRDDGRMGAAVLRATSSSACAPAAAPDEEPAAGEARFTLTRRQLLINQRIAQAAIRRLNAVQERLDGGLSARDLCGHAIGAEDLDPAIATTVSPTSLAPAEAAAPEPIRAAPRRGGQAGVVRLSAAQLLVNQRIGQAAVRRANGLAARLDAGLTGGDIVDGQVTQGKLADRLQVTSAPPTPAPAPSRTVIPPRAAPPDPSSVRLTVDQLRINQRVYQAAVRRANALVARLEAEIAGDGIRDGSLTAADLAAGVVPGAS